MYLVLQERPHLYQAQQQRWQAYPPCQAAIHNNRLYEKVISISQSRATWHYTMENLLGLAAIDLGSLRGGAGKAFVPSVLHITSFSPYTMQWLQVVLGGEVRICSVLDPSHVNKPCMSKTTNTLQHKHASTRRRRPQCVDDL